MPEPWVRYRTKHTDKFICLLTKHEGTENKANNDNCHSVPFPLPLALSIANCVQSHSHAFFPFASLTRSQMCWNECRIVFSEPPEEKTKTKQLRSFVQLICALSFRCWHCWYFVSYCIPNWMCVFWVNKAKQRKTSKENTSRVSIVCHTLFWRFGFVLFVNCWNPFRRCLENRFLRSKIAAPEYPSIFGVIERCDAAGILMRM